jgi:Fur family peroxide stress response transcriptional regulator
MKENEAYERLIANGVRPSAQRLAIMEYLLTHHTHPTVEEVYRGLNTKIPTLSRTTVYNTLRILSEHHAAQMLTIDDHHICYDGDTEPHVHFFCKHCGKVLDLMEAEAPAVDVKNIGSNIVDEVHLYYKGTCAECARRQEKAKDLN